MAEERLGNRVKHSPEFPTQAIRRVLAEAGLRLRDVTHVAFARDTCANRAAKMRYVLSHPGTGTAAAFEHFRRRSRSANLLEKLPELCGEDRAAVRYVVVPVEHHLAHIASAYYTSPFDEVTAGFSYDASGDFVSAMAARCEGTRIDVIDRVFLPDSIGFFYTALCQLIGFSEFGEEYKVMGLAAYGEDAYAAEMAALIRPVEQGWYRLRRRYFGMHEGGASGAVDSSGRLVMGRLYKERLESVFGAPRERAAPVTAREQNIARSTQSRFEELAVHCLRRLHALVPSPRLALAGGCALNGVMNARIPRDTPFQSTYLQCAASDDGTCIGAAYWCYHNVVGGKWRFEMNHAYWGPEYGDSRIRSAAQSSGFPWVELDRDTLLTSCAGALVEGKVVGWYQGRSEWGPRALGNRSILASPSIPGMKDLINLKVKRRESFRPFAPTVLAERAHELFEQDLRSPFMMHVVKIRPEWRPRLPAVTHVDGTGRLQTVGRDQNPLYYDLIERFSRLTGVPAVLNTSFNENEPIVDTPEQAIDCFRRNDLDTLVLGNVVLSKAS
jgi:carbamoyltransferase